MPDTKYGPGISDTGHRKQLIPDTKYRKQGYWIKMQGYGILDTGNRDIGYRVQETGLPDTGYRK